MKVKRSFIHKAFRGGLLIKGLYGFVEFISGFLILFVSPSKISEFLIRIFDEELLEDPNNFVANGLISLSRKLSTNTLHFGGFYLIAYGLVHILIALSLILERPKYYLLSISVFSLTLLYQLYRIAIHHSLFLVLITLADFFILYFVIREYRLSIKKSKQ